MNSTHGEGESGRGNSISGEHLLWQTQECTPASPRLMNETRRKILRKLLARFRRYCSSNETQIFFKKTAGTNLTSQHACVDEVGDEHQPQPMPTMPTTISPIQKPKLQPGFSPKPAPRKQQTPTVSGASPSPSWSPEPITGTPHGPVRKSASRR